MKSISSKDKPIARDLAALALVAAWPFVFYWRAALGLGLFYFGDIARFFYPTRLLYANALRAGSLALWTPELLAGFPLFAEMQTGVLYPLHLALYRLLPLDLALNYDILLHLAWLGSGLYVFARGRGLSRAGALLAAFAFSAGGFGAGRITHLSVLAVAAWLPWTLWLYDRWRRARQWRYLLLLTLVYALQFLAGHPQFILLNILTFAVYVGAVEVKTGPTGLLRATWFRKVLALAPFLTIALGASIAAVQLVPTFELSQASARAGGVTETFFTEFSYHPFYLTLLLAPFSLGNPYPRVSVEVLAYVGVLPLLLALGAPYLRRTRATWFWAALALGALMLAVGGYNPLYRGLRFLPLLNFFRVPARFLFPFELGIAMLAGVGFDALRERLRADEKSRAALGAGALAAVLIATSIALVALVGVEAWLEAWRGLPFIFVAGAVWLILRAWRGRLARATFTAGVLGLTLLDLAAFGAVYAQTFNAIAPRAEVFARPRVLDYLALGDGARTLTSESVYPWLAVMRESLYPNLNAAYGVSSPAGYTPLLPRRAQQVLANLSPALLNLLGVRYYLIPQLLPVDAQTEAADLANPFIVNPIARPLEIPPTEATGIRVESSLAQSVDLRDGDIVAHIKLTTDDGRELRVPLRAGLDTAEWAYERSDVRRVVKHSLPPLASTFPARSAFPIEAHVGHTYRADLTFALQAVNVVRIAIEPTGLLAAGLIHVQRLTLTHGAARTDVAPLVGKANHALVYRSEDVAVFENYAYAPRAFITHSAYRASDEEALAKLAAPHYAGELLLAEGEELPNDVGQAVNEKVQVTIYEPERVVLEAQVAFDAYVVLADTWDPGWLALVDGQPAPVHRADVMLRAVRVGAGNHRIEFLYRPRAFYVGALVSAIGLAVTGMLTAGVWLYVRRVRRPVI